MTVCLCGWSKQLRQVTSLEAENSVPDRLWYYQKRFIYRLLARHDSLPVWLVADQ
jgi:hypothetical protein